MKCKHILIAALSTCMLLSAIPMHAAAAEIPTRVEPAAITASIRENVTLVREGLIDAVKKNIGKNNLRIPAFPRKDKSDLGDSLEEFSRRIDSSRDLAALDSYASLNKGGPIGIGAATLNGEPVTLMVLGGTVPVKGQATGFEEDVLAAMECSNDYLRNIVRLFDAVDEDGEPVIPADKPVIVSGISLGGMVAQQLLGEEDVMSRFDIRSIICFGSPLLAAEYRTPDTQVVRFCDTADLVPYTGRPYMMDVLAQKILNADPSEIIRKLDEQEVIRKDGGYRSPVSAHGQSYIMNPCWKGYDAMGGFNEGNQLILEEDMEFYPCPRL